MIDIIRSFKRKLEGGVVIGPFSKTSDPAFIEIIGKSGFDFVIIDLEHGPNTVQAAQNLIRAAQLNGILPIVRVKEGVPSTIAEVLDIGAGGIEVPQVTGSREALEIIKLAKFAPVGRRGVCRFVRAAGYSSTDRFKYFKEANEAVIVVQLEDQEAISNIDEILKINGIDVIFIGPYDLSQSLGVPGQVDHPLVIAKMAEIVKKCNCQGIKVGTFVDTMENAKKWIGFGVKYICYSVDCGIFYDACRSAVGYLNTLK